MKFLFHLDSFREYISGGEKEREFIRKDNILFLIMKTEGQLNMILLQKLQ